MSTSDFRRSVELWKMSRPPSLLLLFLYIVVTATATAFPGCEPVSCGENGSVNITYPFHAIYGNVSNASFCGYGHLGMFCFDGFPTIGISSIYYTVLDINTSTITVVESAVRNSSCPRPLTTNFRDPAIPCRVAPSKNNLTFFFNCSSSPSPNCSSIRCSRNSSFCLGDNITDFSVGGCEMSMLPVMNVSIDWNNDQLGKEFKGLVKKGFQLECYPCLPKDCKSCENSGGRWGSNYTKDGYIFVCYCPFGLTKHDCGDRRLPERKKPNVRLKVVIGICSSLGGFVLAFICFCYWNKHKRKHTKRTSSLTKSLRNFSSKHASMEDDLQSFGSHCQSTHIFSYSELQVATDGFASYNELGDGGFGTVYKGKLKDGRTVAIKRLYENTYKRVELFNNEVSILNRLRHQNLVALYGSTSHQSRELLLVYEYISNGTVADHLHGIRADEGALTWSVRMNIAIETAQSLSYLHAIDPPIIHRDIKTNNILLDENFHVKVADFGLSRLFPPDATYVSTVPQGTPGYVDPEYYQCYKLTDKSDVYSFGVVLVELLSSKPAVDISRHRHEINLSNMAINKIQNSLLHELVDLRLGFDSDWKIKKMIESVAEVAFRCLQSEKEMRPTIKEVLEQLEHIVNGNYDEEKSDDSDIHTNDDASLLKDSVQFSPSSVAVPWASRSTTPNTSE